MELALYNCYLDYLKINRHSVFKEFIQLPRKLIIFSAILFLSFIVALYFLIRGSLFGAIVPIVIEFLACFYLDFLIDDYKIDTSESAFDEHWAECKNLKLWLVSKNVSDCDLIKEIMHRLEDRIKLLISESKLADERMDKWTQILAIPVILLIISYTMNQGEDYFTVLGQILGILLAFFLLYSFLRWLYNVQRFSQKREIARLTKFALALQGVLDFETFYKV